MAKVDRQGPIDIQTDMERPAEGKKNERERERERYQFEP
jgi:hypothetical protein